MGSNRVLMKNVPHIYDIYSGENFIEAVLTNLTTKNYLVKLFERIIEQLSIIDPKKNMLVGLESLNKAM